MGRSVSYTTGSVSICYRELTSAFDYNENYYESLYDDLIEYIRQTAVESWPSFWITDHWLDREDHAVLENNHAYIGLSEYCGLVSIWLVPKGNNDHPELSTHWCYQIKPKFKKKFGQYRKIATASNGEAFYEKV